MGRRERGSCGAAVAGERLVELRDLERGTDANAAMELELLGVGAEPERDLPVGEAFAAQGVDEAPRLRAGDRGAERERGTGREETRGRRRLEPRHGAGQDAMRGRRSHARELSGTSVADAERSQRSEVLTRRSGIDGADGARTVLARRGRVRVTTGDASAAVRVAGAGAVIELLGVQTKPPQASCACGGGTANRAEG